MLKFTVLINGQVPADLDVAHAYLVDADDQPVRSQLTLRGQTLFCEKRKEGLAALIIPWTIPEFGRILLSTTHLPDRDKAYNLQVELLRSRVLQNWRKKDEWGYAYTGPTTEFLAGFAAAKKKLAQALAALDNPVAASDLAAEGLKAAVILGENLTLEHAKRGLTYRRDHKELVHLDFGCRVEVDCREKAYQDRLFEAFNYATLPFDWRIIEPKEQEFQWQNLDYWINWLSEKGLSIKAGQMLRFCETSIPDWLYIWEGDFDSIRDQAFEHVLRCIKRYGSRIEQWDIATGLHVENCMKFSLDQLIEMTNMSARVIKKNAPHAVAVLDLVMPWGEYFAGNPRSIWPLKYVEMCVNTGVEFDAIGLQIFLGAEDYYCRDIMEVSSLLDLFGSFGKPVHITAAGVPSSTAADTLDASRGAREVAASGQWHRPWDQQVQREWVDCFYHIAVGKPFVTAVCWTELSDRPGHFFPHAGLLDEKLVPKASHAMMLGMKKEIWPEAGIPEAEPSPAEPGRPWSEYQ
jgi:GH35 family endo-1,4-beta-xylanase